MRPSASRSEAIETGKPAPEDGGASGGGWSALMRFHCPLSSPLKSIAGDRSSISPISSRPCTSESSE
jgi:hypothetical protein